MPPTAAHWRSVDRQVRQLMRGIEAHPKQAEAHRAIEGVRHDGRASHLGMAGKVNRVLSFREPDEVLDAQRHRCENTAR